MIRSLLPLLLLTACSSNSYTVRLDDDPLWDPTPLTATDGVYLRLPYAKSVARVTPEGEVSTISLDRADVNRLVLAPDHQTVLAFSSWPICDVPEEELEDVESEDDCPEDLKYGYALDLIRDGKWEGSAPVPAALNTLAFDAAGTIAAVWLDPTAGDVPILGAQNLTQVVFLDLASNEAHAVQVGFLAQRVLFTAETAEHGARAIVLAQGQVAIVDLGTWSVETIYPLSISANTVVEPEDVTLTGDGSHALVSTAGSSDLYILDLEDAAIDLLELDAVPSDLVLDPVNDRTLVVYRNLSRLDVIEHDFFEVESFPLSEPQTRITGLNGAAVTWAEGFGHNLYRMDVATGELVEYRAENPIQDLLVTPSGSHALAVVEPENTGATGTAAFYDQYYGVNIFDLASTRPPAALALEGAPVGVALSGDDASPQALILMEGVDTLVQLDVNTGAFATLDLEAPPVGIGAVPNGPFVITHDSQLGMLTFLDPTTNEQTVVSGFATHGLLRDTSLPPTDHTPN